MPAGRDSDFDEAFCERVLDAGRAGKSRVWIAADLGCCKQTLRNWEAAHPQFLAAMDEAAVLSQQWWEDAGQKGMEKQGFNAGIWSRSMAARFPDDWRERREMEHSGKIGLEAFVSEAAKRKVIEADEPTILIEQR